MDLSALRQDLRRHMGPAQRIDILQKIAANTPDAMEALS
jgi:hypothetical protein